MPFYTLESKEIDTYLMWYGESTSMYDKDRFNQYNNCTMDDIIPW